MVPQLEKTCLVLERFEVPEMGESWVRGNILSERGERKTGIRNCGRRDCEGVNGWTISIIMIIMMIMVINNNKLISVSYSDVTMDK